LLGRLPLRTVDGEQPRQLEELHEWAARIAELEAEVIAQVLEQARRIAGDRRVPKADRGLATAQAEAVERALGRKTQ